MQTQLASRARPPITLIDTEADILSDLAVASLHKSPLSAALLLEELGRADTYTQDCIPPHIATMLSHVEFVDESTGEQHRVQLVYPKDADAAQRRISVLTPIGAALIGMPRGAAIDWPNRAGEFRRLRILEVTQTRPQS